MLAFLSFLVIAIVLITADLILGALGSPEREIAVSSDGRHHEDDDNDAMIAAAVCNIDRLDMGDADAASTFARRYFGQRPAVLTGGAPRNAALASRLGTRSVSTRLLGRSRSDVARSIGTRSVTATGRARGPSASVGL